VTLPFLFSYSNSDVVVGAPGATLDHEALRMGLTQNRAEDNTQVSGEIRSHAGDHGVTEPIPDCLIHVFSVTGGILVCLGHCL
jgi:hypothetical protein